MQPLFVGSPCGKEASHQADGKQSGGAAIILVIESESELYILHETGTQIL